MLGKSSKVFLACAIGAGIGSLVALEVSQMFWWLGLIIGGFTGYLSYDWQRVVSAIPQAATMVAPAITDFSRDIRQGLRTFLGKPRPVFWSYLLFEVIVFWWLNQIIPLPHKGPFWADLIGMALITIMLTATAWAVLTILLVIRPIVTCKATYDKWAKTGWWSVSDPFDYITGICSWREAAQYHFDGLRNLIPVLLIAIGTLILPFKFGGKFGWVFFKLIHSDLRLLCGVDAMIGSAVGYFSGSAIIGAIAGGLFGLLNYEVVSKRFLRLHVRS